EMEMSGISVGMSQTIPWPGMLAAKSRQAKFTAEAESAEANSLRNSLVRKIKHFYYEYSYWSFAENVVSDNIKLSEDIITYMETRYGNGGGSLEEVSSARVSKSELVDHRLHYQEQRRAAYYMLKELVNDTSWADTTLVPFMTFSIDSISQELPDYTRNPEMAGASARSEAARAKLSLAKSEYWPELMIGADYLIRKFDTSQIAADIMLPGEDMWSFHFGFTLPLWFFAKQKKMTTAAKFEIESARAEERAIDIELKQSIREAQLMLKSLAERKRHFQMNIIPLTEAAYSSAHVAYEVGQIDFQSLLEDQIKVYESKLEHIEIVKEYHQTKAYLDELIGLEYGG
ncbi:MAG TPA: TolC family protein, partial [candidate division Zixibacteria bacterium]|nr:TolC family protein [candidate division Zixibacteria bacterium]